MTSLQIILTGSVAALLGAITVHGADVTIDTTGGVTITAPTDIGANVGSTDIIGAGTLTLNGAGTVGLGNNGPNHIVNLNMSGGLIDIQTGVNLQNGGWQDGVWTNNFASVAVAGGATLDVWDGNQVRVDALTGAGTVTISPAFGVNWAGGRSFVVGVNGGTGTFTGNIAGNSANDGGSLSLTKEGAGTQTLTGTNTYNGTTTISNGILRIGNGGTSGSLGTGNTTNNAALVFNRSDASSYGGAISGTGSVTKEGAGTQTLTGSATYGGATAVNGGTLKFVDKAPNSSGALSIASGATLEFNVSSNVALGKLGGTTVSGSGTFVKSGAGLLGLDDQGSNHAVTFNMTGGLIDIQGGVLRNGGWQGGIWTNNLASLAVASGATLDVWDGNPVRVNALTGAGTVTISTGFGVNWTGARSLVVGVNGGGGTFTGTIAGNSGSDGGSLSVTKQGAGTQTLSGPTSYNGGTTVNGGRLVLVNTQTGSPNFTTNAELEFNVTAGLRQLANGTINGTGNLIKTGVDQMWLGANGAPQTVALTGANSIIDVQGGVLRNEYGNSAWGGNKAGLNVASGAFFDLWDGNTTVDELTGSGTVNKAWSDSNTLTVGVNNGSGTFSGAIYNNRTDLGYAYNSGNSGGDLTVTKIGTGTQTFSGTQTYRTLNANGGITNIDSPLGTGNSTVNVAAVARFGTSQTLAALNIGDGAVVTLEAPAPPAPSEPAGFQVQAVPEPGAVSMLAGGLAMLIGLRRWKGGRSRS